MTIDGKTPVFLSVRGNDVWGELMLKHRELLKSSVLLTEGDRPGSVSTIVASAVTKVTAAAPPVPRFLEESKCNPQNAS